MRPIRLTMCAFGPYRDEETIDFEPLHGRGLFVISGQTGAGKTTVFDALCYALYGAASGEDRAETRMLRSHFAGDGQPTSVDFQFMARGRTYRVFRQLPHRRAGNKSETGGKAELYELTESGELPVTDRFHIKEVDARLEELVGLTKDQFSQIVMLPQGEFRKLLTSDTENKEEILRRLFGTELYRRLEESFAGRARELREAVKDNRQRLLYIGEQVKSSLPPRQEGSLSAVLAQEHAGAVQLLDGLAEEERHYAELAVQLLKVRSEAETAWEMQRAKLAEAARVNGRLDELDAARRAAEQLEARGIEMSALEKRLAAAEQAERLAPYEEQAQRAAAEAAAVEQRRGEAAAAAERAALRLEAAGAAAAAEEAREPERREAEREQQRLGELLPSVRTLGERRAELERLRAGERRLAAEQERAGAELERSRAERRELGGRLEALERELEALPDRERRLDFLLRRHELLKLLQAAAAQAAELERSRVERERAAAALREETERLEQRWIEGQAGRLAAHLHDGKPCPVCGSESHPAKALEGGETVSREELQAAKERLLHLERELAAVFAQAAAAMERSAEAEARRGELEIGGEPMELQLERTLEEGRQLRVECQRLKALQAERGPMREALGGVERRIEALEAERERLQAERQPLALDIAARSSRLEAELATVPEPLRDAAELERRLAAAERQAAELGAALRRAQELLSAARTGAAEAAARLEQLAEQARGAAEAAETARRRLTAELAAAGFASAEAWLAARMAEAARGQGRRELEAYRSGLAAQRRLAEELERELAGSERSELDGLAAEAERLGAERESADARWREADRCRAQAGALAAAVGEAARRYGDSERELEEVADLHEMLKGDNALKISFERYILIEFLEQILHAANERLRELSSGQFVLERSGRLEARGRQSGLGLDVYDSYTGQNRDVKSLSGGEKFNASLALALGMTDVIQSSRGGVSIDMMFIDEGFGSLDEESLGRAISALADLQKAGRLIGVISHVQELKDAFPAVLEVRKTKEGHSSTRLVLK
ncbi:SMC family ATPase [Paenibacillus pasadenensis]|uniref:AAA family ATPase n=1 Tax=Paenibacillus pasadenensis TaxID=217090 RepID=UPI00203BD610|nr:SMC family ATPase [Paenibacillus pasadenensis]MCM3746378.1 SMC family ATPase [Paenibacillus pasadenensis]